MFHPFRDLPIATLFAAFLTCARHCCVHIIRSLKSIHQPKKKKTRIEKVKQGEKARVRVRPLPKISHIIDLFSLLWCNRFSCCSIFLFFSDFPLGLSSNFCVLLLICLQTTTFHFDLFQHING